MDTGISSKSIITGNITTKLLADDNFVNSRFPVFGAINDTGNGFSAIVSGSCFSDYHLYHDKSDILTFIDNLLRDLLIKRDEKLFLTGNTSIYQKSLNQSILLMQDDSIRLEIEKALSKLTSEVEVDVGLFLLARLFENSLRSYLKSVELTKKIPIKTQDYSNLNNMINWLLVNKIVSGDNTLKLLRIERNDRVHGLPSIDERLAMLKTSEFFAMLYIQYIEMFTNLREKVLSK